MREELGSRNVSNKTVDMHSPSKISLYLHQKTILSRGLYLVRKMRSNPFQRTVFSLETISLCGDIHKILHKWETCQQFCKSLYSGDNVCSSVLLSTPGNTPTPGAPGEAMIICSLGDPRPPATPGKVAMLQTSHDFPGSS